MNDKHLKKRDAKHSEKKGQTYTKARVGSSEDKLKQSKFRFLNEQLYTTTSEEAAKLFKEDPSLFADYHEGYRQQVEKWPKNPLDILIDELKKAKYLG
jgi:ribosomal RNA-processing protein 8